MSLAGVTLVGGCQSATSCGNVDGTSDPFVLNEGALQAQRGPFPIGASTASLSKLPDFGDVRSMFKYVLQHTPARPVVYPTERYYYYRFPIGARLVSGNIRFAEAESGSISVGYFDAQNQRDMFTQEFADGRDGVRVTLRESIHEVDVSVDDVRRTFVLDQSAFAPPTFPLLDGERLITGLRDESGYFFYLIYWEPGRSMYYVLNPDRRMPESWTRAPSDKVEVWFGDTSRFCFIHHPPTGRFILVGVNTGQVERNTWFDGPFDQVPPHLPIKAVLEEAYPYVKKDAGGIDEHGNFLKMPGQRVAISPYQDYVSGAELVSALERQVTDSATPSAWVAATYEYKRDWRAPNRDAPLPQSHAQARSATWPANHWGGSSRFWSESHAAMTSVKWPPNHRADTSEGRTNSYILNKPGEAGDVGK